MLNSQYREEQHILFPSDAAGLLPVLFIVSEIIPANEELGGSGQCAVFSVCLFTDAG